jgi:hypothetical protein
MSPWWIGASSVLIVAGALVAAIAWRITREVEHLTRSVVALRSTRSQVREIEATRVAPGHQRWTSGPDTRR